MVARSNAGSNLCAASTFSDERRLESSLWANPGLSAASKPGLWDMVDGMGWKG